MNNEYKKVVNRQEYQTCNYFCSYCCIHTLCEQIKKLIETNQNFFYFVWNQGTHILHPFKKVKVNVTIYFFCKYADANEYKYT